MTDSEQEPVNRIEFNNINILGKLYISGDATKRRLILK